MSEKKRPTILVWWDVDPETGEVLWLHSRDYDYQSEAEFFRVRYQADGFHAFTHDAKA